MNKLRNDGYYRHKRTPEEEIEFLRSFPESYKLDSDHPLKEESLLHVKVRELSSKINKQKEDILKERLKQLGINSSFELINNKMRFPKFLREIHPDREEIWYNDGTEQGQLIITFYFNFNSTPDFIDLTPGEAIFMRGELSWK